jgi:hypothetical protein
VNFLNGSIHHQDPQRKDEIALGAHTYVGREQSRESIQSQGADLIGSSLTDADYAALERRWIDRGLAARAQLRRVNSLTGAEVIGRKSGDYAGLVIPYFHPESNRVRDYRLRRDHPDLEYDFAGNLKVRQKYLSAPGRSNMLYLPPGVSQSLLREPALPIVLTEGEFKTLALWRAANHGTPTCPRFLPVGVLASTTGAEQSAKQSGPTAAVWMLRARSRI